MQVVCAQPSDRAPARVAPLSVLPVFLDLAGRRALVTGGSDAAAWKAELLAAAGARVHVFAPDEEIGCEMARLLRDRSGDIGHRPVAWTQDDLTGAAVAVADAVDEAEAERFAAAARAAGVPFNVIDRPAFCQFQFGSIVNRSPVVVGISTSGAAPILGQAIRRRIETLLPATLAPWAGFARRVRDAVAERFTPGPERRAFWEAVVDRAFGSVPPQGDADLLDAFSNEVAHRGGRAVGRVTFVGAGPGDPEHLTMKALRVLQAADVVLFDDLVSDEVLELARREAGRMVVGQRTGRPGCRPDEIIDLMVRLAMAGRHVVRLEPGDPAVFGREEMACLSEAGIGYTIVPGITAGTALAAGQPPGRTRSPRPAPQKVSQISRRSVAVDRSAR